eukprot:2671373-Prymnesium_polylepis.2
MLLSPRAMMRSGQHESTSSSRIPWRRRKRPAGIRSQSRSLPPSLQPDLTPLGHSYPARLPRRTEVARAVARTEAGSCEPPLVRQTRCSMVCGDFNATIEACYQPPHGYLQRLCSGRPPSKALLERWRTWSCVGDLMARLGFTHSGAPSPIATTDRGGQPVDWIFFDKSKFTLLRGGMERMFGREGVPDITDHHLVYAVFAPRQPSPNSSSATARERLGAPTPLRAPDVRQ